MFWPTSAIQGGGASGGGAEPHPHIPPGSLADWSNRMLPLADWSTGLCRGPKGSPGQNRGLAWLRVTPRAGHAGEWYRCEGRSAVAYWPPGEPAELPDIGSRLGHDRGEGSRCVTRANGSSARHTWPTTGAI